MYFKAKKIGEIVIKVMGHLLVEIKNYLKNRPIYLLLIAWVVIIFLLMRYSNFVMFILSLIIISFLTAVFFKILLEKYNHIIYYVLLIFTMPIFIFIIIAFNIAAVQEVFIFRDETILIFGLSCCFLVSIFFPVVISKNNMKKVKLASTILIAFISTLTAIIFLIKPVINDNFYNLLNPNFYEENIDTLHDKKVLIELENDLILESIPIEIRDSNREFLPPNMINNRIENYLKKELENITDIGLQWLLLPSLIIGIWSNLVIESRNYRMNYVSSTSKLEDTK